MSDDKAAQWVNFDGSYEPVIIAEPTVCTTVALPDGSIQVTIEFTSP